MLAERLAAFEAPSLDELGGLAALSAEAETLRGDVHADRLIAALVDANALGDTVDLLVGIVAENPFPLVIHSVIAQLAAAPLPNELKPGLTTAILSRIGTRQTPPEADMASECLAGAYLLSTAGHFSRFRLMSCLEEVLQNDPPHFIRRAAVIAGLSWARDRMPEMKGVLQRLAANEEAGDQATYELALTQLDEALTAPDQASMIAGLKFAEDTFSKALEQNPDLEEAEALGASIRALVLFCDDASSAAIEEQVDKAKASALSRQNELDHRSLRSWLRPRIDAELAWYELTNALQTLSGELTKRSWLRAVPVLERVAALRRALIPLAAASAGDTLRKAVADRLANSFLEREGLRAHLQAWVLDGATSEEDKAEGRRLLTELEEKAKSPGKAIGPAMRPNASGPTDDIFSQENPRIREMLATVLQSKRAVTSASVESAFSRLSGDMENHPDFAGSARHDVELILFHSLRFLHACLDIGSVMAGEVFGFLFEKGGAKPLEVELQRALLHWLKAQAIGFPEHTIVPEAHDVASGRADLAIILPTWRFIIEVKREYKDGSQEGLKKYLGQTAGYISTKPRIGMLAALDLCAQKTWPFDFDDNCWVEAVQMAEVADGIDRRVIVIRIPGCRKVPSSVKTPSASPDRRRPLRKKRVDKAN
ncbi:hypothetical protein [Caenispirillum bisanense]|uniref:hypothetical protein n=1 Tax=Caenispirillum bisanense TaxID=414052 RepID=UPI0031D1155D